MSKIKEIETTEGKKTGINTDDIVTVTQTPNLKIWNDYSSIIKMKSGEEYKVAGKPSEVIKKLNE